MSHEPIENRRLIRFIFRDRRLTAVISFVIGIFQRKNRKLTAVNLPVDRIIDRLNANEPIRCPVNREVNHG
jgi:hypothetical protein